MSLLETIAKQEAKRWLEPYVLRGDTIEQTVAGCMGIYSHRFSACVGGYAWYKDESVKLKPRQVAVTRIGGIDCLYVFSLVQLYDEILYPERVVEQVGLF